MTTNQTKNDELNFSKGLYAFAYDISEYEISEVIKAYRLADPNCNKTDEELRPFAINEIIQNNK